MATRSDAYPAYSQNKDATYCRQCHGDFVSGKYTSHHDGSAWNTDLMSGHNSMIASACSACHQSSPVFFPVAIGASAGGGGLSSTGCVGCHGRQEDAGHDTNLPGRGAGLRQHHFRVGITLCADCHSDADPAHYTPVAESVPPANYFVPDAAHPNKPTDPCNANGSESKFGPVGLDNDGNDLYDLADPACGAVAATPTPTVLPTPTATPKPCAGDCNGDGYVTIDEILTMVNIALGDANLTCPAGVFDHDGLVTVDNIVAAVNAALTGCAA
ncbi:MAG: hypothetical protein U0587_20395 [Candidatus Binatia bacterium]